MAKIIDPKDYKDKDWTPDPLDTFEEWQKKQNIPIIEGFFIEDINTVELSPWDFKGGLAAFVNLEGTGGTNDGYICEILPGKKLKPQRHMYEEMVYVTKGQGATTVWQRDGKKHTFEWGTGSLFAIPVNADYQHFNSSGTESARFYSVTNCCFVMNLFHSEDYVFNSDYVFRDRFDPEQDDYFGSQEIFGRFFMTTNFVPDTRSLELVDYGERGKGSTNMKFDLAGNTMGAHISEFPVGTYKKGHRHGPGAHVIIVGGQGYSILWPDGQEPQKVNWKPGSIVVPPDQWFHQHFNSGAIPARYLALRWNNWRYKFMKSKSRKGETYTSIKDGGSQIEFEDENAAIHRDFEASLTEVGAKCAMGSYHPFCTHKKAAK
jgi:oxalate decarboxylase/phosphoglucose isomerase-like protein (cupin superfamily)